MQFRDFLASCKYTRGGFLRRSTKPKLPPMDKPPRSQSVPPMVTPASIYNPGPRVDARGNAKKINPAIVSKYAELIFQKHLDNASSDDVRLLYAQANDSKMPLPGMKTFVGEQGVDLVELETDMASTYEPYPGDPQQVSPYGLASVREEPVEEQQLPPWMTWVRGRFFPARPWIVG